MFLASGGLYLFQFSVTTMNNGYMCIFFITFKRFLDINVMGLNMLRMTKAERGKEVIIICQQFLDDYTITNTITITHSNIKRFLDVRPKEEKSSAKIRTWVLRT